MSVIDTLIADRTQEDVDLAIRLNEIGWDNMTDDEKSVWATDLKGGYNYTDLNRVGEAVAYLTNLLDTFGYTALTFPKTDWVMADKPNADQTAQYLGNVVILREILQSMVGDAPALPDTMARLSFTDANNIEKTLSLLEEILENMEQAAKLRQANTFFMTAGGVFNNAG